MVDCWREIGLVAFAVLRNVTYIAQSLGVGLNLNSVDSNTTYIPISGRLYVCTDRMVCAYVQRKLHN
jgi:hypothetical protein